MIIPVVVKYFNGYAAIAPAAATSEDTTLPMLMKYTSGEVVMMAVLNGIICSAAVSGLINCLTDFMISILCKKKDGNSRFLTFIYNIAVFLQQFSCIMGRRFVVKFNTQNAFFKFTVMYNADIFDADIV